MQDPTVRLHLFFATENDRAVILRQGPTRQFRMILWHRETDRFEDGQWLKKKVYPERAALSPDGLHFLYFALDGNWQGVTEGAYTALSRPPYWTALALYPEGSTWAGGGYFLDNLHYFAVGGSDVIGCNTGLSRVTFGAPEKGCSTGIRLLDGTRAPLPREVTRRILDGTAPATSSEIHRRARAPTSDALDRYDTQGGMLYRRKGLELELIRDFNDMAFERIRAPYSGGTAEKSWRPDSNEGTSQ